MTTPTDTDLAQALREAMHWNWLDDDARPSEIAGICDAALAAHESRAQPASVADIPSVDDDLRDYGIGFEVDGKRVAPARVRVFKAAPQPQAKENES